MCSSDLKVYREEREQPLLLGVDLRAPMHFGTRDRFKAVAAAELCALLAWAALADADRVGGVIATDGGCALLEPRRSDSAVLHLLARIAGALQAPPDTRRADAPGLDALVVALAQRARAGHRCVLVSDFHDLTRTTGQRLQQLARLGSVTSVLVFEIGRAHV